MDNMFAVLRVFVDELAQWKRKNPRDKSHPYERLFHINVSGSCVWATTNATDFHQFYATS